MDLPGYDKTAICPYDRSHVIMKSRMQAHLIKCSRNHPELKLERCPFDITHHIRREDMQQHMETCAGRETFDTYRYQIVAAGSTPKQQEEPVMRPPRLISHESWDDCQAPSYVPESYANSSNVLRSTSLASRADRNRFRDEERKRLGGMKKN